MMEPIQLHHRTRLCFLNISICHKSCILFIQLLTLRKESWRPRFWRPLEPAASSSPSVQAPKMEELLSRVGLRTHGTASSSLSAGRSSGRRFHQHLGGADVAPPCDPTPVSRHSAHRRAPCFFVAAAGSVLSSAAQIN